MSALNPPITLFCESVIMEEWHRHRDFSSFTIMNYAPHSGDRRPLFHCLLQQAIIRMAVRTSQHFRATHAVDHLTAADIP